MTLYTLKGPVTMAVQGAKGEGIECNAETLVKGGQH